MRVVTVLTVRNVEMEAPGAPVCWDTWAIAALPTRPIAGRAPDWVSRGLPGSRSLMFASA